VGIMMERTLELIIGILGILKAGGAYLPIDPDYPQERTRYMLADSGTRVLLTDLPEKHHFNCQLLIVNYQLSMSTDSHSLTHLTHPTRPTHLCYIIYTSGSTGRPKGVMVEHAALINFVYSMYHHYDGDFGTRDNCLSLTNICFDVSVCELFLPFSFGSTVVLFPGKNYDVEALVRVLVKESITYTYILPSLLKDVCDSLRDRGTGVVLNKLLVGVEPVKDHVLEEYAALNKAMRIVNGYGPTEATICAATYRYHSHSPEGYNVPIGTPLANTRIVLLDRGSRLIPIGVDGHLCIGGDGLARGYLNRLDLTGEKFAANPFIPGERMYLTGDLARRLPDPDGNIVFSGRVDDQVKIRGFRVEPGEVANRLKNHDKIKEAFVMARTRSSGSKYLCAYIVSDAVPLYSELREYLAAELPGYMIPSYFVHLDQIPLNQSGKVDRKSLPEPKVVEAVDAYAAPRDEMEEKLVEIWSGVLGIEKEHLGIDSNFFDLGGHSLNATLLVARMHKVFDAKISLMEFFKRGCIRELAKYIKEAVKETFSFIESGEEKEYYPLSPAQKRLYILHQVDEKNTAYNIPAIMELKGSLDINYLEAVFRKLIQSHESLRTSFHVLREEPIQKINDNPEFEIEYYDLGSGEKESIHHSTSFIQHSFIRSFDLSQAPLMRAGLIATGEEEHVLMLDMHHIITDGTSMGLFVREFISLYANEILPPLPLQYRDYSEWQHSQLQEEALERQASYWQEQFSHDIPILELPLDFTRPLVQSFDGARTGFELAEEDSRGLKELAASEGLTLYTVLLAVFYIFLSRISNSENIIVGTAAAGRRHADLEQIIGMFVTTLALKNHPKSHKSFKEFLKKVNDKALEAFENQDYPFEELVERLPVTRDTSRNPLFDVMFVIQNVDIPEVEIPGLKFKPLPYKTGTSKFDLMLQAVEEGEKLLFTFEYGTALFKEATVERFKGYFKRIASAVREHPLAKLSEIEIISPGEKRLILEGFNNTRRDYPSDKTIHGLFEEQVESASNRIAVVGMGHGPWGMVSLTYRELNEKSNQLAALLIKKGIEPGDIVGIIVEHSMEMVTGVLGILKAGGAYLPIDPGCPGGRIEYMLADSNAEVLLTDRSLSKEIAFEKVVIDISVSEVIDLNQLTDSTTPPLPDTAAHRLTHSPTQLCYVIYTSGSTGNPKGVLIEHRSVFNILDALDEKYPFSETCAYLLKTSFIFDVSVTELFGWFFGGGRLVIMDKGGEKDPQMILDAVECAGITHINFVPSMFHALLDVLDSENITRLSHLKYIFLAGEALLPGLVERFNRLETGVVLENIYGPTEAAIYASRFPLSEWTGGIVPIGKPMQNTRLYIFNKYDRMQPIGVVGELCIAGDGLARGYLNRPGLTTEKFDRDFQDLQDYQDEKGPASREPYIEKEKEIDKNPLTSLPLYPSTPLYHTGDLARWLPDGNIEFLGRMDHQVKIRGFRVELGEIENQLEKYAEIREAVVLAREDKNGDRYLCAYVVSANEFAVSGLKEYLAQHMPGYMIPPYFVQLEQIPLTLSGKVNMKALPEPEVGLKAGKEYSAPRDEIEEKLADLWCDILGIEKDILDIGANFFDLGGHSLKASVLVLRIHQVFHLKVPLAVVFKSPTIIGLARYIRGIKKDEYASIESAEEKEYYTLSLTQKRFYIMHQLEPENISYNLPMAIILEGNCKKDKLEMIFRKLIKKHESLRTSFEYIGSEPVQRVHHDASFKIEYFEATGEEAKKIVRNFTRPFDLKEVPLMRVGLIKIEENRHILKVEMHHIITDGISMEIFLEEFMGLYNGKKLHALRLQYKDFSEWQKCEKERVRIKKQHDFWMKQFEYGIPTLKIPTDYPRPKVKSFEGNTINFDIAAEETKAIKELITKEEVSLYMVLLSIYYILLSKLSGQEDIVVGTGIVGRSHADLMSIIGLFFNTIVLRNQHIKEKSFKEFLKDIKSNTLESFENQDYPFDKLVEELQERGLLIRDSGRNPLFDTMFAIQNFEEKTGDVSEIVIPGLKLKGYNNESKVSRFDLFLIGSESNDIIRMRLEYSTVLFKSVTAEKLTGCYIEILNQVLKNNRIKLKDITISSIFSDIQSHVKRNEYLDFGF
jgi:amino acid adenylation domain-containing protein